MRLWPLYYRDNRPRPAFPPAFCERKLRCRHRLDGDEQQSTGPSHLDGFESCWPTQKKEQTTRWGVVEKRLLCIHSCTGCACRAIGLFPGLKNMSPACFLPCYGKAALFESCILFPPNENPHPNGWGFSFGGDNRTRAAFLPREGQKLRLPPVFELVAGSVHRTLPFRWVRVPLAHTEKEQTTQRVVCSFSGGHILVKFELKTDSISCRVRVSVPSL